MIDFDKINQEALTRAEQSLSNRFTSDAYIVYCLSKYNVEQSKRGIVDYVDGSNIDEELQNVLNIFVNYAKIDFKTGISDAKCMLETMLNSYEKIFTELYTLSTDNELRGMIKNFFSKFNKILPD